MHALSFSQSDGNFYMDTGATSHMFADQARLIGDGKTQQPGVDCDETFNPVVKPATIFLALLFLNLGIFTS